MSEFSVRFPGQPSEMVSAYSPRAAAKQFVRNHFDDSHCYYQVVVSDGKAVETYTFATEIGVVISPAKPQLQTAI